MNMNRLSQPRENQRSTKENIMNAILPISRTATPKSEKRRNAPMKHALAITLILSAIMTVSPADATIVLQADFNGEGNGTGGANDIMTLGGTAELNAVNAGLSAAVETAAPLGYQTGGYLETKLNNDNDWGTNEAVAEISPSSSASSWASIYDKNGTGERLINGGFDFLFRSDKDIAGADHLRVLDTPSLTSSGGGFIRLDSTDTSDLVLTVRGDSNSIDVGGTPTYIVHATAQNEFNIAADTVYRIAASFETDTGTGETTMRLFAAEGDEEDIDNSASSPDLLASTTFNLVEDLWSSEDGFATGLFDFGILAGTGNAGSPKTQQFDQLRLYNEAPSVFASNIPEPTTALLLALAAVGLLNRRPRR